jgi:hypothetical protein
LAPSISRRDIRRVEVVQDAVKVFVGTTLCAVPGLRWKNNNRFKRENQEEKNEMARIDAAI